MTIGILFFFPDTHTKEKKQSDYARLQQAILEAGEL